MQERERRGREEWSRGDNSLDLLDCLAEDVESSTMDHPTELGRSTARPAPPLRFTTTPRSSRE